jgi:hypothetical protein
MAQRPSFDMTKLSTADKILGGGSLLLFIDSFLNWQRACVSVAGFKVFCGTANAWSGNGGFAGVIMSLAALALLIAIGAGVAGISMPATVPMATVTLALIGATVLFGLIKFLFVIGNEGAYGAWIGIILLVAIAYGGYMKMQESNLRPGA